MAQRTLRTLSPRLGARGLAALTFVGGLSVSTEAWAWTPALLEADASDGAALGRETFPVPDALRSAVQFWRDLFTRHTSDRVVVHDRESMDVVWRVIELPKDEAGLVAEARVDKVVRAEVDAVRARLQRLASDPTPADDDDRVLLALVGGDAVRLDGAWLRLRTQRGVADHFRAGLARSRQWSEGMRGVLAAEGVPPEIAVLPFVESMFNPVARSYCGAAGLWQLMPATARGLGLKVKKGGADERYDVLKATRAAARLLKRSYQSLGSWPLALTAYNHGPNGVRRAVEKVGSTDLIVLIDKYEQGTWGFASKNFYAEFLAALSVLSEPEGESVAASSVRE